ncbi:MAG: hypothetical protein U9Q68_05205 [Euryarchaeota archaeon]|nr:hypothetical protein [Euryarchaeota archaeon]
MTTIATTPDGEWYIVTFFPDAVEAEIKTNEEKGWRVTTGWLDGEAVPMRAYYKQDMYTLDDVQHFAEGLHECEICKQIGRDMSVTSIDVQNNYNRQAQPEPSGEGLGLNRRQQPTPPMGDMGNLLMDSLFTTLMDTTLTPLGKIMTANLIGNEALLAGARPKTEEEAFGLAADYLSADTPRTAFFRNPTEMKKIATALRARVTPKDGEEEEPEKPVFKRAPTRIIS